MADKTIITKDTPADVIERDIAQTRDELSRTVGEIEERFSSGHFKARVREKINEKRDQLSVRSRELAGRAKETAQHVGTIAQDRTLKARDRVLQFVKDNPAAVLVISFELGALIAIGLMGLVSGESEEEVREQITEEPMGTVLPMPSRVLSEQRIRKAA